MRIAYLAAGAAGMYCGSCLHDNTLAAALLKLGEDVILAPIYTPIRTDEVDVSEPRVFFGGINAYLQQKFPIFRRTPRWLDGWLDNPKLLNLATKNAASVDASKLGEMTVSMLRGELGNQRKELEKLVDWLIDEAKPDVVHLSNSMMLGLARLIRQRGGPPIVCSLSGEDIFLEKLTAPHYEQARQLIRERAADVDAFVALNNYFADFMADYMSVPRERIEVIPHGLDLAGHGERQPSADGAPRRIGYFARICYDKGLHLLIDAAERLALRDDRGQSTPFTLHAAGYLGGGDRAYLAEIEQRVARGPLAGRFTYHGELDRPQKIKFLQSLDMMAVPTVYRESKGLSILEALANAVPVVLPNHGAFPEILADTGGGVLHEPLSPDDLAAKLAAMLADSQAAAGFGERGRQAIVDRYQAPTMARRTLELYRRLAVASNR
ncbi:glycosyltransferase family 4 protein [Lacipirellula sp.]|uniref:glycosyltransferase family 4 protein n=1 Tax=Lacipirellula sp. TaxID=2691419 RepID=UPI003D0E46E8